VGYAPPTRTGSSSISETVRAPKRATLCWNDFSDAGFSRSDVPLKATLQFCNPISTTTSSYSAETTKQITTIKLN
jgi:hypothetical protein